MQPLLGGLTVVGTVAMLWVGGGILVHGLERYHLTPIPELVHQLRTWAEGAPMLGEAIGWLAYALASALVGLLVGAAGSGALHLMPRRAG
jgi:predicted DNA repair protein MutK